jgi:hypothetical protein
MTLSPSMISKEQHVIQLRYIAAMDKIESEATPEELAWHRHLRDLRWVDYDFTRESEIDRRVRDLMHSDWQPEEKQLDAIKSDVAYRTAHPLTVEQVRASLYKAESNAE